MTLDLVPILGLRIGLIQLCAYYKASIYNSAEFRISYQNKYDSEVIVPLQYFILVSVINSS